MDNTKPSASRLVRVHEKKMETYNTIEHGLEQFNRVVTAASIVCPFGHDSITIQEVVNYLKKWCTTFSTQLNEHRNKDMEDHITAFDVMANIEKEVEDPEDIFAAIKSNVVPELELSHFIRSNDIKAQELLEERLKELQNDFLGKNLKNPQISNKENSYYNVVE